LNADDVENFLSRWSRRKLEKTPEAPKPDEATDGSPGTPGTPGTLGTLPAQDGAEPSSPGAVEHAPVAMAPAEPLPEVGSLTPESDFKPFMRPEVDPGIKQAALKQLFKDPHFNVMDGLDTYIEDFSKPDPIPDEMMKKMYQARELLFSPEEKAAAEAGDLAEAAARAESEAAEQVRLDRKGEELQHAFADQPTLPAKDA